MRIGLCTTTIHIPHALKLMRKCSADVRFFVAIDEKTPSEVTKVSENAKDGILNCYVSGGLADSKWKCSEAIGWNTLARRNIAFLEALAWGADVIYSWDNDNLPASPWHFGPFDGPWVFHGIKVLSSVGWFDPGALSIPAVRHRGIPIGSVRGGAADSVTDIKLGVMAGLILGDPDIDATTRMEIAPRVVQTHLLGQTGVVVDPHTWTVFNSQNTAVIRELIPAWFMMPGVGRHDDIYASLIVQRVARERNLHVHFGPPFTYQQRNEHNLITDLRAEIDGMENVSKLADLLDSIILPGKSVIADTRIIYEVLGSCPFIPQAAVVAALTFLDDCEGVM